MTTTLFSPLTIGTLTLKNRIVMAPLTRNRASDNLPGPLHVEYYRQRAGAGLIVTEGTPISPMAQGYADTPGLWSEAQIAAWAKVTAAVHGAGGKIAVQLWHVGRVSHADLLDGQAPLAPSAIAANSKTFFKGGFHPTGMPRALTEAEIAATVEDFRTAARNAMTAGFDAVELHGANGYLIDQFLRDSSNHRQDGYGGAIENRMRFLREVLTAVTEEIGSERTGIRLSPWSNANDVGLDSDTEALFTAVVELLNAKKVAFLHMVEGQTGGPRNHPPAAMAKLHAAYRGAWIANNGFDRASAMAAVASGAADAVAFGKLYISNPDLAERLAQDAVLNALPSAGLYGGGAEGFVDYPALPQPA